MNASPPTRRTLIGAVVAAGASVLTGCAQDDEPRGKGKGKGQPSPTPSATDADRLGGAPPAADTASARSTGDAWRYAHVAPEDGIAYHALAVTSREDVWLLGVRGQSSTPFLEHWDGKRWTRPEPPDALISSGRDAATWALATGAPDEVWLVRATGEDGRLDVFHREDGAWRRLPDPPAAKGEFRPGGAIAGAWCVASGKHLWATPYGKVVHWDGKRWDAPPLGFPAAALAAAPGEEGVPRAWAAGWAVTECAQEAECPSQPATAAWADGAWHRLDTPAYRFPDPAPPEESATLETIVHDPVRDRVWALGRHDFNHGEVDEEPDTESIVLSGDGTAWERVPTPSLGRAFMTATTVPDGTGGLLLDSRTRRAEDGKVHKVRAPGRLPEPSEVPKPKRKYDFGQPFDITTARLIPGTRTVLAAGGVTFNNSSDTGDPPRRAALARYDADGKG